MNPYKTLPSKAFWRPSVADLSMFEIEGLWEPKFAIRPEDPVATFGSCFAQHIGRNLRERGFNWLIAEAPPLGLSAENALKFNYGVFSARTGNIYTTSLLRQWTSWALGKTSPPLEFWEQAGRVYDPFRPSIEPDGFEAREEMINSRDDAIQAFRICIKQSRYFVFTLGLTESWVHTEDGYEYPMCPGTVAGEFDERRHRFVNQTFGMVRENLAASMAMMREVNPELRFVLTVSPVPLTATYSGRHVLVATMYSKSVLRAVAGQLAENNAFVDYFPSYEIFNSPVFRGAFFEPNQRNAASHGVAFAMEHFFNALSRFGPLPERAARGGGGKMEERCDEELLEAFAGGK